MNADIVACIGCGAAVPAMDGPQHHYLTSAPGCWRLYGEILAREYEDLNYWRAHHYSTNAYAVQHPGAESPQTIQSINVHLTALYLIFERNVQQEALRRVMKVMAMTYRHYHGWRFRKTWVSSPSWICTQPDHRTTTLRWPEAGPAIPGQPGRECMGW